MTIAAPATANAAEGDDTHATSERSLYRTDALLSPAAGVRERTAIGTATRTWSVSMMPSFAAASGLSRKRDSRTIPGIGSSPSASAFAGRFSTDTAEPEPESEPGGSYSNLVATYLPAEARLLPVIETLAINSRQPMMADVAVGYTFSAASRGLRRSEPDAMTFQLELLFGGRKASSGRKLRGDAAQPRNPGPKRWQPVVGASFLVDLARKWNLAVAGDAASRITGSSDMSWNVMGSVGHRLSDALQVKLGYRVSRLDSNQTNGSEGLNRLVQGPQVGFSFTF